MPSKPWSYLDDLSTISAGREEQRRLDQARGDFDHGCFLQLKPGEHKEDAARRFLATLEKPGDGASVEKRG